MTNEQIIQEIAIQVYGEAAVQQMIEDGIEVPLHTVQGWAQRGPFKIKKGEHGLETRLWRKKKKSETKGTKEEVQGDEAADQQRDFYLCKAFLFRADQVEKTTT